MSSEPTEPTRTVYDPRDAEAVFRVAVEKVRPSQNDDACRAAADELLKAVCDAARVTGFGVTEPDSTFHGWRVSNGTQTVALQLTGRSIRMSVAADPHSQFVEYKEWTGVGYDVPRGEWTASGDADEGRPVRAIAEAIAAVLCAPPKHT